MKVQCSEKPSCSESSNAELAYLSPLATVPFATAVGSVGAVGETIAGHGAAVGAVLAEPVETLFGKAISLMFG